MPSCKSFDSKNKKVTKRVFYKQNKKPQKHLIKNVDDKYINYSNQMKNSRVKLLS